MNTVDRLLQGSIDMHIHHGPDVKMDRRVDALQAALMAQEAGMRAIVLKSHAYPTAPLAYVVNQVVENVTVFGSISLDFEVGGLNVPALEASAKLGARVVWMPTSSSANDVKKFTPGKEGITILDEKNNLLPVVEDILTIVSKYDMTLGTGHISRSESFALVDKAREMGIQKLVITHPLNEMFGACLSLDEQCQMADKGAYIEHCAALMMPLEGVKPARIVEAIKAVGPERCILSTDLGQGFNPAPAEGMRVFIAILLRLGVSEQDIEIMVKKNPGRLLGLS